MRRIVVETVGVGQYEVDIASMADTSVVVMAPGMGDDIQAAKAGILEIGDVFVVNKADRDGADATVRDLRHMISLGDRAEPGLWRPPVVKTVAAQKIGIDEVMEALDKHRAHIEENGELVQRRERRVADEIETIALATLRVRLGHLGGRAGSLRWPARSSPVAPTRMPPPTVSSSRSAPDPPSAV